MSIYRTNNPQEYAQVDGIVIDERAPAPNVQGVGTGVAIIVGQFQRGPTDQLIEPGSQQLIAEIFGRDYNYLGYVALLNKRFSRLKIIRAIAADAAIGSLTIANATVPSIQFKAKYEGDYSKYISITSEAGSTVGQKYTVQDTSEFGVIQTEVYDDIEIASVGDAFSASKLVDVNILDDSSEPIDAAIAPLTGGSDGTIADTDYETAIKVAEAENSGNVLFLDDSNSVRNGYLKSHAQITQDKMVIVNGDETETVTAVETSVATLRDTDGRIIYAFNWLQTLVNGVNDFVSPASFYASIISQTSAHVDPAYAGNTGLLYGVSDIKQKLTRADYIRLMAAGVSSFEFDSDIGFKIKSGIVTQIANSSKLTVLRRRMSDFLTNSIGKFLKIYQNDVNSQGNREAVKGAILSFIQGQESLGVLPSDSEVQGGNAKLVDIDSLNTDDSIAAGKFFIKYKQRIFSSMRFIVLIAEIGESVVVTEGEE